MGRMIETVEIENALHLNRKLQFEAMVDTGAAVIAAIDAEQNERLEGER